MVKPTPEQIAAAERYASTPASDEEYWSPCGTANYDAAILARAYLQHLDASRDDGLPIDEAWLLSIGFEKRGDNNSYRGYYLKTHLRWGGHRPYMLYNSVDGWKFSIGATTLLLNPTRGKLRRLLEALSINLAGV